MNPEELNATQTTIPVSMLHDHSGQDSVKINLRDLSGGFESITSDPNLIRGRIVYGITNAKFRGCDGTTWKDIPWSADVTALETEIDAMKFGGDGSDGAYTNDTGAIDLGGATVVVKNYSSIIIDTQHHMSFTSPHANGTIAIIRCSGNATIGAKIQLGNDSTGGQIGASGGAGGAGNADAGIAGATGSSGNNPTGQWDSENNHYGTGGTGVINESGAGGGGGGQLTAGSNGTTTANATAGSGGAKQSNWTGLFDLNNYRKTYFATCGAGGAGGGGGSGAYGGTAGDGGDGGRGGGALILEVAGDLNVTGGAIEAEGANGVDGDNGGGGTDPRAGGAGGGGAGGTVIVLYKGTLTGAITPSVVGGTGGTGGVSTVDDGGNGGNGAAGSYIFQQYIW